MNNHNNKPPLERFFKPSTPLESKALYLEETLENMVAHSDYLFKKIKILEKKGKDIKELKDKRDSIVQGIKEVYNKCNTIWKDIKNGNGKSNKT